MLSINTLSFIVPFRYWEEEVPRFTEAQFQKEFHVSKRTFNYLCSALRSTLSKKSTSVGPPITLEKRIAVALALLAAKNEYNVIAQTFGIGKSTVSILFKQFCNAVVDVLFGKVVQLPSGSGFREEADIFALRWVDIIVPIALPKGNVTFYF